MLRLRSRPLAQQAALAAVVGIGAVLRLGNLGYSNFQGDEIRALVLPGVTDDLRGFLFDQRKGPLQFLVTYVIQWVDPHYSSELVTRLPFALAATASIVFFFAFVELHFGWTTAIVATSLYATDGMVVALSRIVQYQSLVMLFVWMALYFFSRAVLADAWRSRGVLIGSVCWALGVLAHYDALLILPFVLYLVVQYFRAYRDLRPALVPIAVFSAMVAAFYVPFALSISSSTMDYWSNRLVGGADKISSSTYLFKVYNPFLTTWIYAALTVLGLAQVVNNVAKRKDVLRDGFLILWIAGVVIFFEGVVNLPGTHISNYLMPLMILMGMGAAFVWNLLKGRVLKAVGVAVLGTVGIVLAAQSYVIYVDHSGLYPWGPERIFGRAIPPVQIQTHHTSLFGFPYDGGWRTIKNRLDASRPTSHYYLTNDKNSISDFYMSGFEEDGARVGYYVYVPHPQSFDSRRPTGRIGAWIHRHHPVFVVRDGGRTLAEVFDIPDGWGVG